MLLHLRFWELAARCPALFGGAPLHRAGLRAAAAGRFELADRLFEVAGRRYRVDVMVPALARMRVHQAMVRAEACMEGDLDAALEIAGEAERRLRALEVIEDLAPPFALMPAAELLARWSPRVAPPEVSRAA